MLNYKQIIIISSCSAYYCYLSIIKYIIMWIFISANGTVGVQGAVVAEILNTVDFNYYWITWRTADL